MWRYNQADDCRRAKAAQVMDAVARVQQYPILYAMNLRQYYRGVVQGKYDGRNADIESN